LEFISGARRVPSFPSIAGSLGLNQRFRLAAQDVRFQPIVQVQPELLLGTGRQSVRVVNEPLLGLVQPAALLLGLPESVLARARHDQLGFG
jgi:hypothetical protein